MLGLFEDGELVLVQLLVDLSDLEAALADDFDGARHSRLSMLTKFDRSKCTTAELTSETIVLCEAFNTLKGALGLE